MCSEVLEVRREGYYEWQNRPKKNCNDEQLISALKNIRKIHKKYGTKSLLDELPIELKCSYGKGYKVCRDNGILTKTKKKKFLTKSNRKVQKSEDLVNRDFKSEKPGTKWFTDISEVECCNGKLYLNPVLDSFDGTIVGLSMADHMRAELSENALKSAINRYGHEKDCIVHSDHGSQYTSNLFRNLLKNHEFRQSMGKTGCCFDNARMESFFATLKKELVYDLPLSKMTKSQIRLEIFAWVEGYYNSKRRNTANEQNLAPLTKRNNFYLKNSAA